jgi:hypothetical protein
MHMKYIFFLLLIFSLLTCSAQNKGNLVQTDSVAAGQVVINEFMAINASYITDTYGEYDDWIEIYNNTASSISLDNVYVSDSYNNRLKWQFPAGTTIAANAYIILWADNDSLQSGYHMPFKLSGSGEHVILSYSNGKIIDSVSYDQQTADISYGRYPNGTGPFMLLTPTFSAANSPLGINEQQNALFSVYPNPSIESIVINDLPPQKGDITVKLYDICGKQLKQINAYQPGEEINISEFTKGTYILKIETPGQVLIKKIIKD